MDPKELERNPEYAALQGLEGMTIQNMSEKKLDAPPVETPEGGAPPIVPNPPIVEGQAPPTPKDPSAEQQSAFLKEIFGERFKTVEEARLANIAGSLEEVETLRQLKTELETKLSSKPKTNFANDEVALYNEFVRETGTHDYGVFRKINSAEVATMDPMEALVTKHVLDHPELSGREPQVRKYFEKKYNVDPDLVDEEDLEVNKIGMEADGASARKSLQDLKEKLKVPESTSETSKPKELTPEEKTTLKNGWNNVGQAVSQKLGKLNIPIKNGKSPLLDYEVSESEQKAMQEFVANYAVENQMELNDTNVRIVSTMVYNQLMINKLPDIVHSVFEKARNMTEDETHALYENPSPARNNDQPPAPPSTLTDEEKQEDDIFNAEMSRYN